VGKPNLNAAQPYAKAEGRVFLLVPAYTGCPGTKAVKRLLLLVVVHWFTPHEQSHFSNEHYSCLKVITFLQHLTT